MNKQIFTALLLLGCIFSQAQKASRQEVVYVDTVEPYIVSDNTPVSLGLQIGDNQKFRKKYDPNILITPPTIIRKEKNNKGELEIDAFVNSDHINIIVNGVTAKNASNYKAFINHPNPSFGDLPIPMATAEYGQAFIQDHLINQNKISLYGPTFYYTIKDKSEKIVSRLKLRFVLPKPEPAAISLDEEMEFYNTRPAENFMWLQPGIIQGFKEHLAYENRVKSEFDSLTNMPKRLVLPSNKSSFVVFFKQPVFGTDFYLEYRLNEDKFWRTTANSAYPAVLLKDVPIGKHKLQVRFPKQTSNVYEYEFEIEPHWTRSPVFIVLLGSVFIGFVCWILFRRHNKKQKAKLDQETAQRKLVQNQIQALRSQLDPHFIFNALSSIQSLINRNNIEAANLYISKFGALLHQILEKGERMMHPLAIELNQVEHYLQLEQLRFKFDYKISIDEQINPSEIDIPVMLLQPYIENAIKHGIIEKRENRKIDLTITKKENDMIVSIKDNGKGYDVAKDQAGHGNTLVAERITMLNSILTDQQIYVQPLSVIGKGTSITIHFKNWL